MSGWRTVARPREARCPSCRQELGEPLVVDRRLVLGCERCDRWWVQDDAGARCPICGDLAASMADYVYCERCRWFDTWEVSQLYARGIVPVRLPCGGIVYAEGDRPVLAHLYGFCRYGEGDDPRHVPLVGEWCLGVVATVTRRGIALRWGRRRRTGGRP